ncbi:helix-turn-helix domain-containing protein [Streptosporangium sp. NBC_01755]|uniref:helix-turn-helix domain-containing protein n=1 Tax=Streptosporangium sp. NBC_01755 TaxID=2975949 RepID=UPI002DDB1F9E|nr:helix-turn-helix domain-containing protein [Streptosporangium sp. NBC_01755]WSD00175.1 helix-turn-helix domain-containing protein [Streptosporangium sp. NBC_01755]
MGKAGGGKGRPDLLRARLERGMTQEEAAAAVGVAVGTWGRWERSEQGIRPHSRRKIAAVFEAESAEVEQWIEGWALGETSSWPVAEYGDTSTAASVKSAALLWRYEMDESRRHLLATLPFVPSVLAGWITAWNYSDPPQAVAQRGNRRKVGQTDIDRINEARKVFSNLDDQFGAGLVRPTVVRYLDTTVTPLLRGRYDDQVGSALMSAAAGMTWLAGWTAFDLNQHGQAQQHFGQALRLAKTGNDPLTGVWILVTMTSQALHLEQAALAVWLARAAADTARRAQASPHVMALMLTKQAWATAMQSGAAETHDRHGAKQVERLLVEAERAYAQGTIDRDPAWIARYDEAEFKAQIGRCWSLLGEHRRAADCAEAAVAEFGNRFPRSVQRNRLHTAEAYLGMGELEQSLAAARAAIPATKALTSARSTDLIRQFADRLEPYRGSMMVREFRDHLNHELAA